MNATVTQPLMTTEELLVLPDDGTERWLIRGRLREKPMTVRNRHHSRIAMRIGQLIGDWIDRQPAPRGEVFGVEVGCRLTRNPDTTVGIDVAYLAPELAARETDDTTLIDGPPTLAVEVLSPTDTQEDIHEKINVYLRAGVPLVWVVSPFDETVTVYRPGAKPVLFNSSQELDAGPQLPGFRAAVKKLFGR